MYDKEEMARDLIAECDQCISDGTVDNFASYEEGVRDALLWVFEKGSKPVVGIEK